MLKAISLTLLVYFLIFFVSWGVFGYRISGWRALLLYFALYIVISTVLSRRERKETPKILQDLPGSGPIGRAGPTLSSLLFLSTTMLSALNPFQLAQQLRQIVGQIRVWLRLRGRLPSPDTYLQKARYTLPFGGEWLALNGGTTPGNSHSWHILTQRYAYDFVIADGERRRHTGRGTRLDEYYCYGAPILAAADGTVARVSDGARDAPFVGYCIADFLGRDFRGNFVVIQHAPSEFSFSAHLIPGSIVVREGEAVRRGQPIGRCGSSGHSSEPHLHFHVQDHPDFFLGMGLPVRFDGVLVNGEGSTAESRADSSGGACVQAGMSIRPLG